MQTSSPTHDRGMNTTDRERKVDDYSGHNSPIASKKEPFLLQIEIPSVEALIEHQNFKTDVICQNHKDTHMNIFVANIDPE